LFAAYSCKAGNGISSTPIFAAPENFGKSGILIFRLRLIVLPEVKESLYSVFCVIVSFVPKTGTIDILSAQPPFAVVPPRFSTFQLTVTESPGLVFVDPD